MFAEALFSFARRYSCVRGQLSCVPPDGGTIWWNPNATLTDGNVNLSADSILGHELAHADGWNSDPKAYINRINTRTNDAYDNAEEKRVITGPEKNFQLSTGQGVRSDHRGDLHTNK